MTKSLIIVEFKEEAEFLLERSPGIFGEDAIVLSLLPEASAVLIRHGIAFENSVPYFSKSSHERCLKEVDRTIRKINASIQIHDGYGLRNAYKNALTFYLRQYLSYVVLTIETIANVIERHGIQTLHVCHYEGNDHSGFGMLAKERILGEIAGLFNDQIKVCPYALNLPEACQPDQLKKILKPLISALMFPLELSRLKKHQRHPFVFYSLKYYFDHIARAFGEYDHYNVVPNAKTFTQLVDRSGGVDLNNIHLSAFGLPADHKFAASWQKALEALKGLHAKEHVFRFREHDFSSIIFRKCEQGYGPELKAMNRQIAGLKKFLNALKPSVVLSHVARDFSYALGELAEAMNIPSVLISHGSHVPPKNEYDRMEWSDHGQGLIHTDYRYHLLQSPWAVEHVRAMGYRKAYHAVEPLIFPKVDRTDKEKAQLKKFPQSEGKRIVMHAGTPKPRGSNRLYIYETLDEYISYMRDLVEAARKIPDIFLVIRFRPYPYLSTEQLKALLPKGDHYVVATDGSFADYLKIADLMVSFSSTTIEEALINSIPVLQYDPTSRYMHIEGAAWQDKGFAHADSVYYIGGQAFLVPGLKWILANHLNTILVGDLFERHVFKSDEAISVTDFIKGVIDHDVPAPIRIEEKKHLDGVEMF